MIRELLCSNTRLKRRIAESRDRLYRVALAWCGDPMLADDLVQETITIAIEKHAQLRSQEQLQAWLYRILNNNWARYLRNRKTHSGLDDQIPSGGNGPLGNYQTREIVLKVREAVATLPMEQRQVISLVDLEELSYCVVAEALDIPIGTVMSRLHRARKKLSATLETSLRVNPVTGSQLQLRVVK